MSTTTLPDADDLRDLARKALGRCGVDVASLRGDAGSRTPVTGADLLPVPWSSTDDVDRAVSVAHEAFLTWRVTPAPVRGALVKRLGELLRENLDDLADLVSLEVGKIRSEARGEVQEMVDICDFAVGLSRQLYGRTMPSERPGHRLMETWHPLGVVGVISAFNFPVAVWSWNTAVALVCGDTVVWKPSELTPLTALACTALLDRAAADVGAPEGLGQLVLGDAAVAERLVDNTARAAGERDGFGADGARGGTTGRCQVRHQPARARRQQRDRRDPFGRPRPGGARHRVRGGRHRRPALHVAAPDDRARERGRPAAGQGGRRVPPAAGGQPVRAGDPRRAAGQREGLLRLQSALEDVRADGGEVLVGGDRQLADARPDAYYVAPSVARAARQGDVVRRETFAPLLHVLTYSDLDEAIALQNGVPQGLSSSIFTSDQAEAERFLAADGADCGIVNVNIGTSGAEIGGAFGGQKETGGGRESGSDSWKAYMRRATNTINYSGELPLAQGVDFTV